MDIDFTDDYSEFVGLGFLPVETLQYVYTRGWPVIFSAWSCSSFKLKATVSCIRCIAKSYRDWPKLRQAQVTAGIPRITDIGYYTLIKTSKASPGWVDMPRILFFSALDECKNASGDPTKILFTAARLCKC